MYNYICFVYMIKIYFYIIILYQEYDQDMKNLAKVGTGGPRSAGASASGPEAKVLSVGPVREHDLTLKRLASVGLNLPGKTRCHSLAATRMLSFTF